MISKVVERHDAFFQRFFEVLPGLMIWILILSPFWAGKTIPLVMADFLVVLAIYWFYRSFLTTVGTAIGYLNYRSALKQDWLQKTLNLEQFMLPEPETLPVGQFLPKHLIVFPVGAAEYEVLYTTLDGLRKQNYPLELIHISISLEERLIAKKPEYFADMKERILREFTEFGDRLMIFEHPDGLPGEVVGAAANRTWGARKSVEALEAKGEIISDFLITSPDEDIVFHPQYLAAASYQFLTISKRKQRFYQTALYTFNNNHWDVPILIRTLSSSLTIPILASSIIEKDKRETFSCYTLALDVLQKVDYWDVSIGIDDTTFYWRPFFYFKGDWSCEVFFIPLSADAVYNPNYIANHREQYKQYLRWGWGVISFPIGFKGLLKHTEISLWKRINKMWHLFEVFIFFKVLAYLITVAIPLILFLNPQFNELVIWYTIPDTVSKILSVTSIFLLPATLFKFLLVPKPPADWPAWKTVISILLEVPLTLVTLMTYSFLPFVEASTRMMFGQATVKWSGTAKPKAS